MNGAAVPIKFGTDGWRAIIAQEFTFANLERVAQAYADYLLADHGSPSPIDLRAGGHVPTEETGNPGFSPGVTSSVTPFVIIGFDRRFLSEQFARRVAEVLGANGLRIALFQEAVPTPLVSWSVKELNANGGVVITASHNPPEFNGFKIKAPWGGSAAPETTSAVEKFLDATSPKVSRLKNDEFELLTPTITGYREQVSSYVDLDRLRRSSGLVVVDPMHGSGGRWLESFLSGGNLKVETIRSERDPLFGGVNPEPIDRNLAALKRRVIDAKALVGLATDGDADRVGAVSEVGETMTMHDVVPLILLHLARNRQMTGGVVRTFSQSVLLQRIATAHNLKLYETPIGFKYIAELMLTEDILIGAEESGGIGVKGHIPERDGLLNSLLFLEAVVFAGKAPSEMLRELHREFGEFHFGRRDLHLEVERGTQLVKTIASAPPEKFAGYNVEKTETLDGTKLVFEDESWLLFRQSGTEPVLRIYSEAGTVEKVERLLDGAEQCAAHISKSFHTTGI